MTLTEMRTRVTQMLMDTGMAVWSTEVLDEALRQALAAYSTAAPCTGEVTITIPVAGDVDLNAVSGLVDVIDVRWPYQAGKADALQPVNRVTGWRCWRDLDKPTLELRTAAGTSPASGDDLRVRYTLAHQLSGLDGAEQSTIPLIHYTLLVRGAAGYAALFRAVDRVENRSYGSRRVEPTLLQSWADAVLQRFHRDLDGLRGRQIPPRGNPRWRMDVWDSR
jgi:hypothetical protein